MFAWSCEDMPGIDPKIAQHHIDTHNHMEPVKQKLRRMRTEWLLKIKEEVTKQLKVGFIKPVRTYVNHVRKICHLELANPLTKHTLLVIG